MVCDCGLSGVAEDADGVTVKDGCTEGSVSFGGVASVSSGLFCCFAVCCAARLVSYVWAAGYVADAHG